MIKILLYSNNSEIIDKISRTLNKKEFYIHAGNTFKNLQSSLDDIKLIIVDITEKKGKDKMNLKNLYEIADKKNIPKLIITNFYQTTFLLENEIKFDDFVFNTRLEEELFLRIKTILLKKDLFSPKNSIVVDGLALNLDKYELSVNERLVELTFKEFELLKILLQNQNKVFTRNKLLSTVWEYEFYGGSRTVDVHMRRLRSKIPPPYNHMFKTVRNVGYMFSPQI